MYQAKCNTTAISSSASTSIVALTAASQVVNLHTIDFPKTTVGTVKLYKTDGTIYFTFPAATVAGTYVFDTVLSTGLIVSTGSSSDTVFVNWYQ